MRKSNREIKDFKEIINVLYECDTVRIAFNDEKYPYIVPMSFGCEEVDSHIVIYTHGAKEGKKHTLLEKNPHVCVEADIMNGYQPIGGSYTADYKSIIGFGEIEIVRDDDAIHGIELLMEHCGQPGFDGKKCVEMSITEIFKITLDSVTGKKRF